MEKLMKRTDALEPTDRFPERHIGPDPAAVAAMLEQIGFASLDALTDAVVPDAIRHERDLELPRARGERALLLDLAEMAGKNEVFRSYIGMGYHDCVTPPVILRNVLENPAWYTQYTPYQAEIAQGRLEALLNFQTLVADLTGLPLANASLLDEGTAAAEAMTMCRAISRGKKPGFFVADSCHPQTIEVVEARARPLGIDVQVGDPEAADFAGGQLAGILLQYPDTLGRVRDHAALVEAAHASGTQVVVACDLLALTLLRAPGEFGADIAVGSSQRFGVPLGYGGPHAAFLATRDEHKRLMAGRIVGVSKDDTGQRGLRLAMQTREQHIRRDKATSNICTAQALLATVAGFYAVYHGPDGLRDIARRILRMTRVLAAGCERLGLGVGSELYFDTLRVELPTGSAAKVHAAARDRRINLRPLGDDAVGVALDETTRAEDLDELLEVFATVGTGSVPAVGDLAGEVDDALPAPHARTSEFLGQEVFHNHHSEHEMLRYLHRLQAKELSLVHSMIPLGSCTMKLNATTELIPMTWPEFCGLHPFAPQDQATGYAELFEQLEAWLSEVTGYPAVSLQPNSGAQGEYAGLMVIRAYHERHAGGERDVCLIPTSAHGTNPASATMAGMRVVLVECQERGEIDLDDLRAKATEHRDRLAALMITYPSTHGVFEDHVQEVCQVVHDNGGLVYLDGANMNAKVGLCRPADIGADVCHLNLHKTFCIPHGGGGPGMGPIGVTAELAPFLPGHPIVPVGGEHAIGAISAAPWGSPAILPISWSYIAMMGPAGLKRASQTAILSANYMARRLEDHYPILYRGENGLVAHEFILDVRPLKDSAGITVDDIAKRLIDFGFHAPTMSWPVAGTLMVEPTESESREELDRFCEAMILIREEARAIEEGRVDRENNVLRRAPHTAAAVSADDWDRPYSREQAAFPTPWVRGRKFWPPTGRIDNAWGDRNLVCTCDPIESYR